MMKPVAPGARAPAFSLEDLRGRRRSPLEDRAGKGDVLLTFVRDDCPTCRFSAPFLERIHAALEYAGVRVYGVCQDGPEAAAGFARETGARFPILVDGEGCEVSRTYGIHTVPSVFLVGDDGKVKRYLAGFHRREYEAIAADLASGLGAAPPEIFRAGEAVPEMRPG